MAAARHLVSAGRSVTVEEAAAVASVSRTTAYRYFPTQRALLLAAHPEMERRTFLPDDVSEDPAERLDAVVRAFTAMIVDTEQQQRTMLRLSLDVEGQADLPLRQGRAIGWITEALQGRVALSDGQLASLVIAVRAATGIEALVWLVDVAGLSRADARKVMRWSAQALLRAAEADPPPTTRKRPLRRPT